MNKRRCLHCKKYFDPGGGITCNFGFFHSKECQKEYGIKNAQKIYNKGKSIEKKKHVERKRAFKQSDLKTRKRAAKEACHAYIRARDKGLPCICCNEPLGDDYHAGHFLESGNYSSLRYNEFNINGQRLYCNVYKGGNSGDYRTNLINKIGLEKVLEMESMKSDRIKRTCEDYRIIESYYKEKLKSINNTQ